MAQKRGGKASPANTAQPTLMRGRKSIDIEVAAIIEILAMIRQHRQEAKLLDLARAEALSVSVPPATVNALKNFVASHAKMREDPLGARIMHPVRRPGVAMVAAAAAAAGAAGAGDECCGIGHGR